MRQVVGREWVQPFPPITAKNGWKGFALSSPTIKSVAGRERPKAFVPKSRTNRLEGLCPFQPYNQIRCRAQIAEGLRAEIPFDRKGVDRSGPKHYLNCMHKDLPSRNHLKRIPVWLPTNRRVVYFVTVCCAERRKVFADAPAVKTALESLVKCADATDWNVPQICFMPDHVHLMMMPMHGREQKLSNVMQRWKSSSKQRLNRSGIQGGIWQREFFDRLLRSDESLTEKWHYVEMNPVRAGLCSVPGEYPYLGSPQEILDRL